MTMDPAISRDPSGPEKELGFFHRLFDRLYPVIRFYYERIRGHAWFSQVTPQLWVGGAPDFPRDYQFLLDHGISAVVNIRAEREDDVDFYAHHNIHYITFKIPDVAAPDPETIEQAVTWMEQEATSAGVIMVHCAKGRGRSATLAVAFLMTDQGMNLDQAIDLLESKRKLTKIESRHRQVLTDWESQRANSPEER
jgi:protein-tyrosine phosphatase